MTRGFYFFYASIFAPLIIAFLQIFYFLWPKKLQLVLKFKKQAWPLVPAIIKESSTPQSLTFWIHAASGELEYARPVLRQLRDRYPKALLLVTYSSPSVQNLLKKMQGEYDLAVPAPWDTTNHLTKFLDYFQPQILFIARTDVWPAMVKESKLKGLKVILFSATFSAPRSGIWRWLSSFVFSPIDQIFCVSAEDQKNALSFIDAHKLKVLGDTRYDQVLWRLQQKPPWLDQLEPWKNEKIFIAGSTWPEDEKILFAAFENIKQYGFKIILAPHEVHADKIVKTLTQFKTMNLQVLLWSHFLTLPVNDQASHLKNCAVLLVDQVGILADLYSLSMVAFVGGSFKHKVHSVMEPLAAGNVVLVGPHHHNNREALVAKNVHLKLSGLNVVHEIQNSSDIQEIFLKIQKADPADIKSFIKEYVAQQSGASQQLVDLVL